MKTPRLLCALVASLLPLAASAATQVFTGVIDGSDPTQTGRLFRNGIASTFDNNKPYPGSGANTGERSFDSYTLTLGGVDAEVTVRLENPAGTTAFCVAYAGSFVPADPSQNYLADMGGSNNSTTMSFKGLANQTVVIVVHEVNDGVGVPAYTLSVRTRALTDPGLVVTTTNDDGLGSLRQALRDATAVLGRDFISFKPTLSGQTLTLGSELLVADVSGGVIIDASSLTKGFTLSGGGLSRVFHLADGSQATLKGLTLTGGTASSAGGAIRNEGTLTVSHCTLTGNRVTGAGGGAVFNLGGRTLIMDHCTLTGNNADFAGAIFTQGTLQLIHCTVSGNTGSSGTGGLVVEVGTTTLRDTIVAGNVDLSAPFGDIGGSGGTLSVSGGNNVIGVQPGAYTAAVPVGAPNANGDFVGTSVGPVDAKLAPLAANGGPTQTMALQEGSPSLNAGEISDTDQRGLPVVGTPDIGAFEVQSLGAFAFTQTGYQVMENVGVTNVVTIQRLGGFADAASVRVSTAPGTAIAADFTPVINQTVNFAAGQGSATVAITIANDGDGEKNESFFVKLSSPSAGSSLGSPATATVTLVDAGDDDFLPSAPTIASPAANAAVGVDVGGILTLTGTAKDEKGVRFVHVYDAADNLLVDAVLAQPGATTTKWTANVVPITGLNTFRVRTEDFSPQYAADLANGLIRTTTRSIKVLRPLRVNVSGFGSVTPSGFSPQSHREVGKPVTITAKPGAGWLFAGWSIPTAHLDTDLGTTPATRSLPTLTFIHREGLALRATFLPNPYLPTAGTNRVGSFYGSITPSTTLPTAGGTGPGGVGTASALDTEGSVVFTVQTSGAFTGTLKIDGASLRVAGSFDSAGLARFGRSLATTLTVPRKDKPAFTLSMSINLGTGQITGTLAQFGATGLTVACDVLAHRAFYSKTNPVPATAFNATALRPATGDYTSVFSNAGGGPGLSLLHYPQGFGYSRVKLNPTGTITLTGKLADNTAVSHSTVISQDGAWRLFIPLYKGRGFVACMVTTDHSDTFWDFEAQASRWVRPVLDTQHYPMGWPQGITINFLGSKYTVTPGSSVLPLAQAIGTGDGNATLTLVNGKLPAQLDKNVDITPADAVIEVPVDATFTMGINRTTGIMSGSFRHADGSALPYSSIIFQKQNGAFGFFQTATPRVKDYTGETGQVLIPAQ